MLLKKYFHLEDLVSPEKQKKLVWGDKIIRKIDFPPVSLRSFSSGKKVVLSSKHKEISSKYKNFFLVENQLFLESIKKNFCGLKNQFFQAITTKHFRVSITKLFFG